MTKRTLSRRAARNLAASLVTAVVVIVVVAAAGSRAEFLVNPYVQNPASDAMTIMWLTRDAKPGNLTVTLPTGDKTIESTPVEATALTYHESELSKLPGKRSPGVPYLHRVRVDGLEPGKTYAYSVEQSGGTYEGEFRTAPTADSPVRFIVYGDSETEPESTGNASDWAEPFGDLKRRYLVDQTVGYAENLKVIKSQKPNFIGIAGDLVETAGEQRDWDEFWRHNAGELNDLASSIPILPAPGNHENYAGQAGGYGPDGARVSMAKFRTYFEAPDNGSTAPAQEDRFYRVDYGPIAYFVVDSSNGLPNASPKDSNFMLAGEGGEGGEAPDFNPGSYQYQWLEQQLAEAQERSRFTFVQFHHIPYSIGPHGFPTGKGGASAGFDDQSGQPLRVLTPLFKKYGVDAVFCGHDETYEHSIVDGIHFFDVGIGGDGLRGPYAGKDGSTMLPSQNPYQVFLAHLDAPEVWEGKRLVSGGKHYGHAEVNVAPGDDGAWTAKIEPVYVFPLMTDSGKITGWERRVYDDVVTITSK